MIKKIVFLKDELGDYYKKKIKALRADFFVYSYESGSYEGSGFAIWKIDRKWFYTSMSHCSCYGPLNDMRNDKNAGFTFKQVKEIAKENYGNYAQDVINYIIKNK